VEYSSAEIRNPLRKLNSNPATAIQQKDSGKISYIKISQQQPFHFDNINLQLSGIKYYNRKVDLYLPDNGKHTFANPGQLLQSFSVSNNSTLQFTVPLTKTQVFYIVINNEDNLPLTLKAVKTACSNHYITAYLENSSSYTMIMDNETATLPNYDLSELNSNLPDSIPPLGFDKVTASNENNVRVTAEKNNTWMLWTAIAAALLILIFFSYKMLQEVDKRKNT
jgi:ABC-type Na+ efflux pump permease subunit